MSTLQIDWAEKILQQGYAEITFGGDFLPSKIRAVVEGMKTITDDPQRRESFPWLTVREDKYGPKHVFETGLQLRRNRGEEKFTFHHLLEVSREPDPQYRSFFSALNLLGAFALHQANRTIVNLETLRMRQKIVCSEDLETYFGQHAICVVRVLRYRKQTNDVVDDAGVHGDRSALTLHLWSSHLGLYLFDSSGKAHSVEETDPNKIVIFPGAKLSAITSGAILPTLHGVRDRRRTQPTDTVWEDRYAIVAFVHPLAHERHAKRLWRYASEFEKRESSVILPR